MIDARRPKHVARLHGKNYKEYPCSCDAKMDHSVGHEVSAPITAGMDLHEGRPTVASVQSLMWEYRDSPGNSVGGNLHVVLDDGNISNDHVQWCLDECKRVGDEPGERLASLLLQMSRSQRARLAHSFYSGPKE